MLLSAFSISSFAQTRDTIIKEPKFKPPVVKTYLGVNQNGAAVTADEGVQLVGLPLKIVDAKNNEYAIDSYQFLYRQKSLFSAMMKRVRRKRFLPFQRTGSIPRLCQKSG